MTLGPLVIHDLPPAVVADGARHTWPSCRRTLKEVVVGHRPLPDVVEAAVPTVVAHGRDDRVAPSALAEAFVVAARQSGAPAELRVLEGDHHLAVRHPGLWRPFWASCNRRLAAEEKRAHPVGEGQAASERDAHAFETSPSPGPPLAASLLGG